MPTGTGGKFARGSPKANVRAPITSTGAAGSTYEGGTGYERDAKSELFLLAVTNMVGEDTFYEKASERDQRFVDLVHKVTAEDPDWVSRFVPYLRNTLFMRSASVVAAAEYVAAGGVNGRPVVNASLARADEPAEMLAYWHKEHGRRVPKAVKRGIADAVNRLYTERAVIKYDGTNRAWRMADVLSIVNPSPGPRGDEKADKRAELFRYIRDRRYSGDIEGITGRIDFTKLPTLGKYMTLKVTPLEERRTWLEADVNNASTKLREAGFTWELLSAWLNGVMDAKAWETIIPSMGAMALVRNLRNFDDVGVSDKVAEQVYNKLGNEEDIRASRMLPLRMYSAWKNVRSMRWGPALETALMHTLKNVPGLPGRTLILIDVSGSMDAAMSNRSTALRWELAALFGYALANRAELADVYLFSNDAKLAPWRKGASVLRTIEDTGRSVGGGTYTMQAISRTYTGHDRVVVLTDEQAFPSRYSYDYQYGRTDTRAVVDKIDRIYTFNLAGYKYGHLPSGEKGRYTFGGLSDASFTALAELEKFHDVGWAF